MNKKIAVCSISDPYASTDGGTIRVRAIVDVLRSEGNQVDIWTPGHAIGERVRKLSNQEEAQSLRDRSIGHLAGLKRHYLPMPTSAGARDRDLLARAAAADVDLVVVSVLSQFQFARAANAPIWFDMMDVWSTFAAREATHRVGLARWTAAAQSRSIARTETSAARRSAIITAAGWQDTQELRARGVQATWLPVWVEDSELDARKRVDARPKIAGLIGNFGYWPNRHAYGLMRDRWLPSLRASGWSVLVAGPQSEQLRSAPGIQLLGRIDDLNEFYGRVSVTLAPIELGGGIKVKVVESLARGIPVIATREALEGLPPEVRPLCVEVTSAGPSPGALSHLPTVKKGDGRLLPFTRGPNVSIIQRLLRDLALGRHVPDSGSRTFNDPERETGV